MIVGTGLDLVSIARFKEFAKRRGERGLLRLFTADELTYSRMQFDPAPSLAARFAAKEAFFKAIGTGMGVGGGWHDVEVVRLASGQPQLSLRGRAASVAESLHVRNIHVSLTHTDEMAAAFVLLEA